MASTDTEQGVCLTTLRAGDEAVLRAWLAEHHRQRGDTMASALGERWSRSDVDAQLLASDAVERSWHALRQSAQRDDALVAIARLDGRPIGVLWVLLRLADPVAARVGDVQWVYVAPWARRHRVASALVEAGREWLRLRGVRGMTATLRTASEGPGSAAGAAAFFERVGLGVVDVVLAGTVEQG